MKTITIISIIIISILLLLLFYNIQLDNKTVQVDNKKTVQVDNKKEVTDSNIIYKKEIVINRLNKITNNSNIIKDKRPLISEKCEKFDPDNCYYWLNCGFSMKILDYDLDFVKDKIKNCKKNKQ